MRIPGRFSPQDVYPDNPLKNMYGTEVFQFYQTGSFRWQRNDPACLVVPMAGPGAGKLPLVMTTGGDSDAFQAPSTVAVKVMDFNGSTACTVALFSPSNGQMLDYQTVTRGHNNDTTVLNTGGHRTVYLANSTASNCAVEVSAAP